MRKVDVSWNVRFEVTFYGVDQEGKSFREIKENIIKFDDNFEIPNKLPFNSKENGIAATATKISEMDSLTIVPTKINGSLS